MTTERLISVREAATILGISGSRVRQVASRHSIGFKAHRFLRLLTWSDVVRIGQSQAPVRRRRYSKRGVRPPKVEDIRVRRQNEPPEFSSEYWREH